jgi:RNA polymerase sigma-70 factor (ECF subfamily)
MADYRDRGDPAAFERLYGRHRGGLYRYLLRQCRSVALAEELFQDVWLSVIRARTGYSPHARFATYLYRIAHNRVIDHYRRSSHRPVAEQQQGELDPAELIVAQDEDQPEVQMLSKQRLERFALLLAQLPPPQREAFVLYQEAGFGLAEIAEATGVNLETAKSRLRYAVAKLKRGMLQVL